MGMTLDRAPSSLCDQIAGLPQLATKRKKAVKGHLAPHSLCHLSNMEISFCVHHWISDFQFQSHESSYKMTEQTCSQMPRSSHSFLQASSSLSLHTSHSSSRSWHLLWNPWVLLVWKKRKPKVKTIDDPTGLSQHMRYGTRREALQHTPWRWQNNSHGPEDRQDAAAEAGGQ